MAETVTSLAGFLGWPRFLAITGGGGKSGLMAALADEYHKARKPVLLTATTRLGRGQFGDYKVIEADDIDAAQDAASMAAGGGKILLAGPRPEAAYKYAGVPTAWLDEIAAAYQSAGLTVIAEADGSRGQPFKALADYEPVLPGSPHTMTTVLGLSAFDLPFNQAVHRGHLVGKVLGRPIDPFKPLAVNDAAEYMLRVWPRPDYLFLNQAESQERRQAGINLAKLVSPVWPQCKILIGSLYEKYFEPIKCDACTRPLK